MGKTLLGTKINRSSSVLAGNIEFYFDCISLTAGPGRDPVNSL